MQSDFCNLIRKGASLSPSPFLSITPSLLHHLFHLLFPFLHAVPRLVGHIFFIMQSTSVFEFLLPNFILGAQQNKSDQPHLPTQLTWPTFFKDILWIIFYNISVFLLPISQSVFSQKTGWWINFLLLIVIVVSAITEKIECSVRIDEEHPTPILGWWSRGAIILIKT